MFSEGKMNCISVSIFLIFLVLFHSDLCYECEFFKNITVRVSSNDSILLKSRKVHGCFGPENFDDVVSELVFHYEDSILYIGDHAVHNLLKLTHMRFLDCHNIENISSRAFENLPNLTDLKISGTKITSLPTGTFKDLLALEFLDLTNNNISEISTDAFGVKPLLEYVILTKNNIQAINHLWFQHCPNLHYISFKQNKIQLISKNSFQFMPNLIKLLLDFNEIRFIEEMSFHHFKDLEILSLVHNKLVELGPNIVPKNFKVDNLDIRANFLNFLSQNLLEKLSVDVLELSGNPWECACLDQIRRWTLLANVTSKNYCSTEDVPQCFNGTEADICSGKKDPENTELFLKELRDLQFPIYGNCANLS